MSALTPHIQALRAEAEALTKQGQLAVERAQDAVQRGNQTLANMESTAATILVRLSEAKLSAADALEAAEPKIEETSTIEFNPKGKPTT